MESRMEEGVYFRMRVLRTVKRQGEETSER